MEFMPSGVQTRNSILEILRKRGPMSRADIARELELSFPTVTTNVKVLIENNLINEVGAANNSLGRKGTLLSFSVNNKYIIGIDIGRHRILSAIAGLSGKEISSQERKSFGLNGAGIADKVLECIDALLEDVNNDASCLVCVGIGTFGVLNDSLITVGSFVPDYEKVSISEIVKKHYNTEVIMQNSVNMGAVGEQWCGAAKGYENILYMHCNVGCGAGIIIDGKLYNGASNASGEAGFMLLDRYHIRDERSYEGALENQVCINALIKAIRTRTAFDVKDADELFELLKQKQPDVMEIAHEAAILFFMCICNTISIIDPDIVVISGNLGIEYHKMFGNELDGIVKANSISLPVIKCSELANRGNVLGTINIAMNKANTDYRRLVV